MNDYEVIQGLSGKDEFGKGKAVFSMTHEIIGIDNSVKQIEDIGIDKPEIRIYKGLNDFVLVDFIYLFSDDKDLEQQLAFMERYFASKNSLSFQEDELVDVLKEMEKNPEYQPLKPLYMSAFTLNIISKAPKAKYTLTAKDAPVLYMLHAERPSIPLHILRMVFLKSDLIFEINDLEQGKLLEEEVLKELDTMETV